MAMVARKKNALKKIWKEKKTEKRKKKENRAPKKKNRVSPAFPAPRAKESSGTCPLSA